MNIEITIIQRLIIFVIAFVLLNIPVNVVYRIVSPYGEWDVIESLKFTFFLLLGVGGLLGGTILIAMVVSL